MPFAEVITARNTALLDIVSSFLTFDNRQERG